ncbi:stage III sporulation protein AA [Acutalibacter caecimuris]|uniref:stage III sporulation protein AA n=1 Tax=Acutalibacter caecimuris TaxID=3093657 RepID=UPI002AC8C013|nr:stage III sporulation protein AA [Acutalibacter sp. M00118]
MRYESFNQVASLIPLYQDRLLALPESLKANISDVRLKSGYPVSLCGREGVSFLREKGGVTEKLESGLAMVSPVYLRETFLYLCGHSVFSHEEEIRHGYVQADGCRIGICGTAVLEKGRVKGMRDITSMVLRIPREVPGCSDKLYQHRVDFSKGVLIAGAPGSGKTTLLRDITQALSTGRFAPCLRIAVLDSRGEISSGFDLGPCADVLKGFPKPQAMDIALRTLSPELILCDELSPDDLGAVRRSLYAGVGIIATVHAGRDELFRRPLCRKLIETGAFGTIVTLYGRSFPCQIDRVETTNRLAGWESRAG